MAAKQLCNACLDRIVRPKVHLRGRTWNAYSIWYYIGFAFGALLILAITFIRALSPLVAASLIVMSILASILLFKSIDIIGEPYPFLIWARKGVYHYQVVSIVAAMVFLWLIDEPILLYLDVLVIGFAGAQISGRIGCLMVGCCHGRPHPWGVCYGEKHLEAGYRNYLQGARLLPVQLFESIWVLFLIILALRFLFNGYIPGEILAWYVLGYGTGRFFLEFLRADTDRLYFLGFSEAQWTTIIFVCLIVCMELSGVLPFRFWHAGAAVLLVCVMTGVGLKRSLGGSSKHLYVHPYHLREVAGLVDWLLEFATSVPTMSKKHATGYYSGDTSLGLQISLSVSPGRTDAIYRYSLSCQNPTMAVGAAKAVAGFIIQFRHPADAHKEIDIDKGVLDILISSSRGNLSSPANEDCMYLPRHKKESFSTTL